MTDAFGEIRINTAPKSTPSNLFTFTGYEDDSMIFVRRDFVRWQGQQAWDHEYIANSSG